ncbi:MAG TPA: OsmC family protein [Paraburkholderia sp.]|uniref:OsmC family protein n=1 Tax=Paraburkholderia sp. TaxID=1926495 RepID=UPI002B492834|nr:OsmC family protein [Paraburkholderia sp.]HKR42081.1 OsmC family protein [Paraburkholderia sp.]
MSPCHWVRMPARLGIQLESVRLELEADVDLAAFFGVDPDVAPGVNQVRVTVFATSPNASREQLQDLIADVEQASTLRDTLVRPVDVVTRLGF